MERVKKCDCGACAEGSYHEPDCNCHNAVVFNENDCDCQAWYWRSEYE